ncbi:MAG: hypothetical protein ACRC67_28450 [Inquilinus sp.]|uniref:hypothetical protein n=1 Tax=Inquilinus sp. TaxID=1932117 RepID=UPI003F2AB573
MDPLVILKRSRPGDHLEITNSNGEADDIVIAELDLEGQQIIPEQGNAIAFGDVGDVVNHSEKGRRPG